MRKITDTGTCTVSAKVTVELKELFDEAMEARGYSKALFFRECMLHAVNQLNKGKKNEFRRMVAEFNLSQREQNKQRTRRCK